MLTADVRLEGFTTEDWQRLLSVFKPHRPPDAAPSQGGLFAVRERAGEAVRIVKLVHTRKGRLEPPLGAPPPLPELAAEHEASWALAFDRGSLDEVMERFGARCAQDDDFLDQSLKLVGVIRELKDEGAIERWPERLAGVPVPSATMIDRTLDALCRDGHVMCLGMFKDAALYTSLVLRRRSGLFDLIAGPDGLRSEVGLLSGDFRRDHRYLVRAVEATYGPLAFGCFAEFDHFRQLQMDARPGAWSRAVAVRDVILSPMPPVIGAAVGIDGARVLLEGARAIASRFDTFGLLDPTMDLVRRRARQVASSYDVEALLGFDPLAVMRALLRR